MNKAGAILCLLTIRLTAGAADTKLAKNLDGNCSISVPAAWSTDSLGVAQSPGKKVTLTVSSPEHGLTSLAEVHQLAPTATKTTKSRRIRPASS